MSAGGSSDELTKVNGAHEFMSPHPQDCDNASHLVPGLWKDESRNGCGDEKYISTL